VENLFHRNNPRGESFQTDIVVVTRCGHPLPRLSINCSKIANTYHHIAFVCGAECHFQQYFSYIVAVSFIDGRNQSTSRKQPTCCKSLTNFMTYCCIEYTWISMGFELTTLVVIGTNCTGSCKSNYHTITTTTAPFIIACKDQKENLQIILDKDLYSKIYKSLS
jgi:hypothetical protein